MNTEDFFEKVYLDSISDLDMYNQIQELTDNFDEKKLQLLCDDFDFYLFHKKEQRQAHVSDEEIEQAIEKLSKQGREIPVIADRQSQFIFEFFKSNDKNKIKNAELNEQMLIEMIEGKKKTIDVERLIYPFEFYDLYRLRNLLIKLKREHVANDAEEAPKMQPIKWHKSEEALRQLIEALKKNGLIQSRETENIIQEHFRQSHKEPKPINWTAPVSLFAYLIEELNKDGAIKPISHPDYIWYDIAPHFLIKGEAPKSLRQTANRYKQNKSGKPKHHEKIDNIIQSLHE